MSGSAVLHSRQVSPNRTSGPHPPSCFISYLLPPYHTRRPDRGNQGKQGIQEKQGKQGETGPVGRYPCFPCFPCIPCFPWLSLSGRLVFHPTRSSVSFG